MKSRFKWILATFALATGAGYVLSSLVMQKLELMAIGGVLILVGMVLSTF